MPQMKPSLWLMIALMTTTLVMATTINQQFSSSPKTKKKAYIYPPSTPTKWK